jgi:copper chaperone CopZ
MTVTITVRGMSCEGCEQTVEDALTDVPGVGEKTAQTIRERL